MEERVFRGRRGVLGLESSVHLLEVREGTTHGDGALRVTDREAGGRRGAGSGHGDTEPAPGLGRGKQGQRSACLAVRKALSSLCLEPSRVSKSCLAYWEEH